MHSFIIQASLEIVGHGELVCLVLAGVERVIIRSRLN